MSDSSAFQRRRPLSTCELDTIPGLKLLAPNERQRAVDDLKITDAQPGEYLCRTGRPVTYWFGVVDGLLKMSSDNAEGKTMTFTGVPPSGWFGEGTALKREVYRYNIQPLRKSLVAGLHVESFHWLLDHSVGFNPVLYPGVGQVLRITQQELAYLVGLSRQRVNEALMTLAAQNVIRVE